MIVELSMFLVGLVAFATVRTRSSGAAALHCDGTLEGQIVTPSLVGRRLTLNPLIVFLSWCSGRGYGDPWGLSVGAAADYRAGGRDPFVGPSDEPVLPD